MIFLNHAATSPVSSSVAHAMCQCAQKFQQPLGLHFYEQLALIESTREMLSCLLGVSSSELAFCSNTSTALSLIAQSIPWNKGDVVLAPSDEFNSNLFVWQNLKTKGVHFRDFAPVAGESIEQTLSAQDLTNVRLISISAVSYQSGRLYELPSFAQFCKKNGIYSCLDAIQAAGATPLDLRSMGVDFAAFGSQKWLLGPIGCGFFYAKKELHKSLYTPFVGWTSTKYSERLFLRDLELSEELTRYEPGLPNIFPIAGLNASLKNLKDIGLDQVFGLVEENRAFFDEALDFLPAMRNPADLSAGISSFFLTKDQAQAVSKQLNSDHILATVRELTLDQRKDEHTHFLRLSPHYYNTKQELLAASRSIRKSLGKTLHSIHYPLGENNEKDPEKKTEKRKHKIAMIGFLPASQEDLEGSLNAAITKELLQRGCEITFVGRRGKKTAQSASIFTKSSSTRWIETDLFREPSDEQAYKQLIEEMGAMDHYLFCLHQPLIERTELLSFETIQQQWHLHCGFFQTFSIALYQSLANRKASLSLILQPMSLSPLPFCSIYHSYWQALYSYARSIEIEWSKKLRVCCYITGATHSKLQKRRGRSLLRFFKIGNGFDGYKSTKSTAKKIAADLICNQSGPKGFFPIKDRAFLSLSYLFPSKLRKRIFSKLY